METKNRTVNLFDENGMLIIPEGALTVERVAKKGKRKTGVFVTCIKCGYRWQRESRREGNIRCHKCNTIKYVTSLGESK